jgi:hypothetical protein
MIHKTMAKRNKINNDPQNNGQKKQDKQ